MGQSKTILIGVSDVFFYTKIRDALRPHDYHLERIRGQEQVVGKAQTLQPTAIVLNMNDEKLNAIEALQSLKGHGQFKDIPILAFANHEEVDTWRQAKELGINKIVSRNEFSARTLALLQELTDEPTVS